MRRALLLLALASPIFAEDREDLRRALAALADPRTEVVEAAERELLIAGPAALPLLRSDAEERIARADALVPRIAELVRSLDADDFAARDEAEKALLQVGAPALPALREAMASGSAEQKARARDAIAQVESGQSACDLARIAEAIGAQPDDACVPVLLALAKRIPSREASPAIGGLRRLGTPIAREALRVLATDGDADRRWSARAAFLALGDTPPGRLADLVDDWPGKETRRRVVGALGACESPDVVPVAFAAWKKEEAQDVRQALGQLLTGSLDAEPLTRGAIDALAGSPAERRSLLVPLLRRRTPESEKALRALLADGDGLTREAAATQAVRLLGDEARPLLVPLLADANDGVRYFAVQALEVVVGREPDLFVGALRGRLGFVGAYASVLERSAGADEARKIPERWGAFSKEEQAALLRAAAPLLDVPAKDRGSLPTESDRGTSGVRTETLRLVAEKLGIPGPRPREGSAMVERIREIRASAADAQRSALRTMLHGNDEKSRDAALEMCVLLDPDGLEEDVLPCLSLPVPAHGNLTWLDFPQRLARGYISPRRTDSLLAHVREMALSDSPGEAAGLWIEWEGRPAVEGLLSRMKGATSWPRGVLAALAKAPLRPEDAPVLLGGPTMPRNYTEEPTRWYAALAQTGAPEAIRVIAQGLLRGDQEATCASGACEGLLRCPSSRGLALRLARATGRLQYAWVHALAEVPLPEAGAYLEGLLDDARWADYPDLARALVLCDPARARRAAAARRGSSHAKRRVAALWLELCLGDRASPEAIQGIYGPDGDCLSYGLSALISMGETRDMRALLPFLLDPEQWRRLGAWSCLVAMSAHTPDGMRNDLFIPCEGRKAWADWIDAHESSTRKELLDAALRDAGLGEGLEARLRGCAEGPWYFDAAAQAERHLTPLYWYFTPENGLGAAAGWKLSLREPRAK